MPRVKAALIGAGSYVFGLSALKQALVDHRLGEIDLALVDVDEESLEAMAGVGRRLAREGHLGARITAHRDRAEAMEGASFVLCAAARQLGRRCDMDAAIIERHCPGHVLTEFGGVGGISYSLRQIALIEEIAADVRRICPEAWLLDSANPLPRVCQAAHEVGVRTAGFCSVSESIYRRLWSMFVGGVPDYPWREARERFEVVFGGLNHFSWLLVCRDRSTGQDLLPELHRRLEEIRAGAPLAAELFRRTGYLPLPHDGHIQDFVSPEVVPHRGHALHHGTPQERQERLELLRDVGAGRKGLDALPAHTAWERPMDFVAAVAFGRPVRFDCLNLVNAGQIAALPRGVFVETPCRVSPAGPQAERIDLPPAVLPYAEQTAAVTEAIVRAARQRSRALVRQAVDLDPTILDKEAGWAAVEACMQAHADVLPCYV